jgi:di/tricarboxylate transporter
LLLGPVIAFVIWIVPTGLELVQQKTFAIIAFMIVNWLAEPIDHGLTVLIGCYLFWALDVVKFSVAFSGYVHATVWFQFGSLLMGFSRSVRHYLDIVFALILGGVIWQLPSDVPLDESGMHFLATLAVAVVFWVRESFEEYVVGLMLLFSWVVFGIVPSNVALSGFAKSSWLFVIAALAIGAAVNQIGDGLAHWDSNNGSRLAGWQRVRLDGAVCGSSACGNLYA